VTDSRTCYLIRETRDTILGSFNERKFSRDRILFKMKGKNLRKLKTLSLLRGRPHKTMLRVIENRLKAEEIQISL
jgi:hypothetical protein